MRRFLLALALLALAGGAVFWWITRPVPLPADAMAGLTGDPKHGEDLFWTGGCASCHAAPGAKGADRLKLGGGLQLKTAFGTFSVPNISPDPVHGIGKWTARDLADAMKRGLLPDGRHLYPAFPYASYSHASLQDVADLKAFLDTLPPVARADTPHELTFPFQWRRLVGAWDWLYLRPGWVVTGNLTEEEKTGRAIVEGLGHCGECHTPRTALGGMKLTHWLAGAPNPSGQGRVPNITPAKLDWSKEDIYTYLTSGFTPAFDSAGGEMADVVQNMAKLPASDVRAIAAYLKRVPSRE